MSIYENKIDGNKRYYSQGKAGKIANDPTKHYLNKNEAEMLRKLMAKTGLKEDTVRSIKTYRKMLALVSKESQQAKRSKVEKYYQDLIKEACRETKLAKEHPLTLWVLERLLKESQNSFAYRHSYLGFYLATENISAKSVVEKYGKKKK